MCYRQARKSVQGRLCAAASMLSLGMVLLSPPVQSSDPNVLPGKGIGRIFLGMRQSDVRQSLGNPQGTYYPHLGTKSGLPRAWQGSYLQDEWLSPQGKYQLDVTYRRGRVVEIATTNPAYALADGTSVKTTCAVLRRRFPQMTIHNYDLAAPGNPPDESTSYYADSALRGIGFEFGVPDNTSFVDTVATSKADALLVHAPGTPILPIYSQFVGEQIDANDVAGMKRLRAYFHG